MKTDPTFWILARASGLTAYVLLTAAVLAGLMVKSRPFGRHLGSGTATSLHRTATDLHRFLSLLGLGAVAVHGISLVLDTAVPLPVQALIVPGIATHKPLWTGAGVVAADLMVVVIASFSLRRFIGAKNWRRLHWATYGVFAAATAHGLVAGTDSGRPWALALYSGAVGAVAAATAWRVLVRRHRPADRPRTAHPDQGETSDEHVPHRDRPVAV
jgi:methionine sulfoxide reductase heme-binding subunit